MGDGGVGGRARLHALSMVNSWGWRAKHPPDNGVLHDECEAADAELVALGIVLRPTSARGRHA